MVNNPYAFGLQQACTEMVMPMSSSQENSMFTAYDFNYSSYKEDCWNTFGVNPRPRWVTTELGGHVKLLLFITPDSWMAMI